MTDDPDAYTERELAVVEDAWAEEATEKEQAHRDRGDGQCAGCGLTYPCPHESAIGAN